MVIKTFSKQQYKELLDEIDDLKDKIADLKIDLSDEHLSIRQELTRLKQGKLEDSSWANLQHAFFSRQAIARKKAASSFVDKFLTDNSINQIICLQMKDGDFIFAANIGKHMKLKSTITNSKHSLIRIKAIQVLRYEKTAIPSNNFGYDFYYSVYPTWQNAWQPDGNVEAIRLHEMMINVNNIKSATIDYDSSI